jgi:hypothetical protein
MKKLDKIDENNKNKSLKENNLSSTNDTLRTTTSYVSINPISTHYLVNTICCHELIKPENQVQDNYIRTICKTCKKVYKTHIKTGVIIVETDENILSLY